MSNDGKELGDIEKVSILFKVRERTCKEGNISADAFDGNVLWLIAGDEEIHGKYHYGEEPSIEQYQHDFDSYKSSAYGQNSSSDSENIKVTNERTV